jgi:hypothetical protein
LEIAKQAGDLLNLWRQQNRTRSLPDMTIAAVALANDLMLVTGNLKDSLVPEVWLTRSHSCITEFPPVHSGLSMLQAEDTRAGTESRCCMVAAGQESRTIAKM